jgi:ribosomal protein S18 acetylase RimI-like enzyme
VEVEVILADYTNQNHGRAICELMNDFAQDPMGGGKPLPEFVKTNLVNELSKRTNAVSFICYVNGESAALVNCFEIFSTFKCKPLVNIHDVIVSSKYRGLGLSQMLLLKVEEKAKEIGCCKITLEVLEGNEAARNAYGKFGFVGYELNPKVGKALFWEKALS